MQLQWSETDRLEGIKVANRPRRPMPIGERTKIFAPFAALKGLDEALAEKEKVRIPKKEISDDMAEEINRALKDLKRGEVVTVIYYDNTEMQYRQMTGEFIKIDKIKKNLQINDEIIDSEDLYNISKD